MKPASGCASALTTLPRPMIPITVRAIGSTAITAGMKFSSASCGATPLSSSSTNRARASWSVATEASSPLGLEGCLGDRFLLLRLGSEQQRRHLEVELLLDRGDLGCGDGTVEGLALLALGRPEETLGELASDGPQRRRQLVERELEHALEQRAKQALDLLHQDPEREEREALLRDVDRLLRERLELLGETSEEVLEVGLEPRPVWLQPLEDLVELAFGQRGGVSGRERLRHVVDQGLGLRAQGVDPLLKELLAAARADRLSEHRGALVRQRSTPLPRSGQRLVELLVVDLKEQLAKLLRLCRDGRLEPLVLRHERRHQRRALGLLQRGERRGLGLERVAVLEGREGQVRLECAGALLGLGRSTSRQLLHRAVSRRLSKPGSCREMGRRVEIGAISAGFGGWIEGPRPHVSGRAGRRRFRPSAYGPPPRRGD